MHILIAEDEPISRTILQYSVEQLGHTCSVAVDGDEAWEIYGRGGVDAIISDRIMPRADGLELCRRVRARASSGYTYFIFLTALSDRREVLSGIVAGADDYLAKPLDINELQIRLLVAARVTALHRAVAHQNVELERLNLELMRQSRSDALTQLGNRLRLAEDLDMVVARSQRHDVPYCAILCDVDEFKAYNDHYGHVAGDAVLRAVAGALLRGSRNKDLIYRYGGEEFLLILADQELGGAVCAADRLRGVVEALQLEHVARKPAGVVTISAGVAELDLAVQASPYAWIEAADEALYRAKRAGRNQVATAGAVDHAVAQR